MVALIITYTEYNDRIEQIKINRSFEFFTEYRSPNLFEARSSIQTVTRTLYDIVEELEDPEVLTELMINTLTRGEHLANYDIILEFFDAVYTCSEIGECDRKTVFSLFGSKALNLLPVIYPVIQFRSESNSVHGIGLECIATNFDGAGCKKKSFLKNPIPPPNL